MSRLFTRHAALAVYAMLLAAPLSAQTTGALTGRVVHDATNQPVSGVEVSIPAISRSTVSDSSGRFALRDIAAARYQLVLRKVGFQPLSPTITIAGVDGPEQILRLAPISTELSKVVVAATMAERRLASFEEHRRARIGGSFLTVEQLEKERGRSLSDVLQSVSGADIVRLGSGTAYFATRRGYDSIMNMPGVSAGDRMRGASPGLCYAAVVVNNVFVYRGEGGDELFDLNSLAPTEILAIEVYKGGATMPLEYNATRKTCGLLVIFTK
jgi:CarboxypepD_reg-like domain/TonB-dependent Receptor Plug Domain